MNDQPHRERLTGRTTAPRRLPLPRPLLLVGSLLLGGTMFFLRSALDAAVGHKVGTYAAAFGVLIGTSALVGLIGAGLLRAGLPQRSVRRVVLVGLMGVAIACWLATAFAWTDLPVAGLSFGLVMGAISQFFVAVREQ